MFMVVQKVSQTQCYQNIYRFILLRYSIMDTDVAYLYCCSYYCYCCWWWWWWCCWCCIFPWL